MPPKRKGPKKGAPKGGRNAVARLSAVTIGDVGELMTHGAAYLRRMLNVEVKKYDYSVGTFNPTAAGVVNALTVIPLGDDYNQRDGHSLKAVAFEWRFFAASTSDDMIRVVLFSDSQCAGAVPTVTQVLEAATPLAQFQHDNLKRFQILSDELIPLPQAGGQFKTHVGKMALDHHIKYQSATNTAADLREGNLFYLVVCTSANTTFATYTRLSFVDN